MYDMGDYYELGVRVIGLIPSAVSWSMVKYIVSEEASISW